eukprot:CAMPEP_0172504032 /NCGR_PEP_ID=MMETSP1066-20121228/174744_1 /TAXON_ID=671091 /ORGANISM="Coscinodiscus wailesii, Strain CCMP2513" /LENGTH=266 /DNA_ID=CAMNT_0013280025 /DNA_START=334 /DNA_END=1135 /DNA_ORIENTATION=+
MTLIYVNYMNTNNVTPVVSDKVFHLMEFWATFGFAVAECVSLVNTPKSLLRIYANPLTLKLVLWFNIVASLVPAILVTLSLEEFEILSHEIEYLNELTMTFVDLVLLSSLTRTDGGNFGRLCMTFVAALVALIQLAVYNGMGRTEDGDMVGEVASHYCEFAFEVVSSGIVFWFCMDNKVVADEEIGLILYGKHDGCRICGAKSDEFEQTYTYGAPLSYNNNNSNTPYQVPRMYMANQNVHDGNASSMPPASKQTTPSSEVSDMMHE